MLAVDEDMTQEQAVGAACVLCSRSLAGRDSVPVELPESGLVVRVCADGCAGS